MGITFIVALLHPGDLAGWQWAQLGGVIVALFVLPVVITAFIICRVIIRHREKVGGTSLINDRGEEVGN